MYFNFIDNLKNRVKKPELDVRRPDEAIKALDYLTELYSFEPVKYELISVVRGPLSSKVKKSYYIFFFFFNKIFYTYENR